MQWQPSPQYQNMPFGQYLQTSEGQRARQALGNWDKWNTNNQAQAAGRPSGSGNSMTQGQRPFHGTPNTGMQSPFASGGGFSPAASMPQMGQAQSRPTQSQGTLYSAYAPQSAGQTTPLRSSDGWSGYYDPATNQTVTEREGSPDPRATAARPGQAQPVQPQSQGAPYSAYAPQSAGMPIPGMDMNGWSNLANINQSLYGGNSYNQTMRQGEQQTRGSISPMPDAATMAQRQQDTRARTIQQEQENAQKRLQYAQTGQMPWYKPASAQNAPIDWEAVGRNPGGSSPARTGGGFPIPEQPRTGGGFPIPPAPVTNASPPAAPPRRSTNIMPFPWEVQKPAEPRREQAPRPSSTRSPAAPQAAMPRGNFYDRETGLTYTQDGRVLDSGGNEIMDAPRPGRPGLSPAGGSGGFPQMMPGGSGFGWGAPGSGGSFYREPFMSFGGTQFPPSGFYPSYGSPAGGQFSSPQTGQVDAFIQRLNDSMAPYQMGMASGRPSFDINSLWSQAGNMVQSGWQNPFAMR